MNELILKAPICSEKCSQYMKPHMVDISNLGDAPRYMVEWLCEHVSYETHYQQKEQQ